MSKTAPTILVVEDEVMLLMVVTETLRDAGYNVLEASNSDTALGILKTDQSIDLLISDIKMPGMNGFQLAEAGMGLRPKLKVMMMTGYTNEQIPKKMSDAGVKVLYKPFDIDQFAALADEFLKA